MSLLQAVVPGAGDICFSSGSSFLESVAGPGPADSREARLAGPLETEEDVGRAYEVGDWTQSLAAAACE
jgi:hypothetical protein